MPDNSVVILSNNSLHQNRSVFYLKILIFLFIQFWLVSPVYCFITEIVSLGSNLFNTVSNTANQAKKNLDLSSILSDLLTIQEQQMKDINNLYKHFQQIDNGDYFLDFIESVFCISNSSGEYQYQGKDIINNNLCINKPSNSTYKFLDKKALENIEEVRRDRNKVAVLSKKGRQNLALKQGGQSLENQEIIKTIEKKQAEDIQKIHLLLLGEKEAREAVLKKMSADFEELKSGQKQSFNPFHVKAFR